jgi:predicted nucleotidyltransferase
MRRVLYDCPAAVRDQIGALVAGVRSVLGGKLAGIYIHGSLAMGCFNPASSDIDVIVLTRRSIAPSDRLQLVALLLERSRRPSPIEISFMRRSALRPWRYPAPFELHFSEDWRARFEANPVRALAAQRRINDPDLAAHIAVTRARGIRLTGAPIAGVFPAVPKADLLDSVLRDFSWSSRRIERAPVYFILNACRILTLFASGAICSKPEGAAWALARIVPEHAPLVRRALRVYSGAVNFNRARFDRRELRLFAAYARREIRRLTARGS